MAAFKCPNCGNPTNRLVFPPTIQGEEPKPHCGRCSNTSKDAHLYTGRKLWNENEVYTRDQLKEKNYQYEERVKKEVADGYKNMRKSTRMRMFGF